MRRILFLAYHFPPVGGGGVQRSLKFVRYLPELGYQPVVVTGPGRAQGRWTPADETLTRGLPGGVEILRAAGPEPPPSTGTRGRAERLLGRDGPFSRWWVEGAVAAGLEVTDVDLVYASMSPFETAEAAAELARRLGKPWVADLRDPWALDEMMVYPSSLHRRRAVARMRAALASADAVVMNTREAAREVRLRFPELRDRPVAAIPNGFDSADFAGPAPKRDDTAFRIVHAGYLHTDLGRRLREAGPLRRALGGYEPGLDILTRSHVVLLRALARVLERAPEEARRIELHLAGRLSDADRAAIDAEPDAAQLVRTPGYLSHDETLGLVRAADLLFLPMHDLPAGRRTRIVPGKTYEYVAARRPLLAAVPDGDARDLLEQVPAALLCRPADEEGMAAAILEQLARRCAGAPVPDPDPAFLARYERRRLTGELARIFDGVTDSPAQDARCAA